MSRFPGHIIKLPANTPSQSSAPGVWTLKDQLVAQRNNQWPFQRDPDFRYTTLLLQGNVPNTTGPQAMNLPLAYNSDASSNNFLITPSGDVSPRPFSPYGGGNYSLYTNSTSNYLQIPSNPALALGASDFCIEYWVYPTSTTNRVISWAAANCPIMYMESDQTLKFENYGVGSILQSVAKIPLNQWTHCAVSRASGVNRMFINGALVATTTNNQTWGQANVNIGVDISSNAANGYISNLRVVKGSPVYTAAFTPPTEALQNIPNTILLTCQSNRFIDNSTANGGTGFAITRVGTPRITDNSPFVSADFTTGSGYFDGTSDYLTAPSSTPLNLSNGDFTIEAWAYRTTQSTYNMIASQWNNSTAGTGTVTNGWYFGAKNSNALISFNGAGAEYTGGTVVLNQWNHYAVVRQSGMVSMYLNGALVFGPQSFGNNIDNTSLTAIGANDANTTNLGGNVWAGYISDFRIVKGVAVYTGAFTPPTRGILGNSGASSAAAYPSTTNVNTTFAASATSLLTLQTRAPSQNHGFIDSSPNELIVTRNGNVSQGTFSPFSPTGWGNYFDGVSGTYLSVPRNTVFLPGASTDFTFEAWVYLTATPSGESAQIVGFGEYGTDSDWVLSVNSSLQITLWFGAVTSLYANTTQALTLNTWYHVAASRSGTAANNLKLFVNGVGQSFSQNSTTVSTGSRNLSIGADQDGTESRLTGYISNIRIINGQALYTGNFTPPTAALTATSVGTTGTNVATSITGTVGLITCQSNRFKDNSPNNFTVTRNGGVSVQAFSPFAPANSVSPLVTGGSGYFPSSATLTIPSAPALNLVGDFCMEGWAYPTATGFTFAWKYTGGNVGASEYWWVIDGTNQLSIALDGGGGEDYFRTAANTITLNAWNHCVLTRVGNEVRQFINGVLQSYNTTSRTLNATSTTFQTNGTLGYTSGFRIMKGSIPDAYRTTATTTGTTVFTPPTAPPVATQNTSLLLNFTGGGIVDATGKNVIETVNHAQIARTQAKWDFQRGGSSLIFDGTTDRHIVPKVNWRPFGTGNFTIECWFRVAAISGVRAIISQDWLRGISGPTFSLFIGEPSSDRLTYFANGGSVSIIAGAGSAIVSDTWYHLAVVRNSGTTTMYLNGLVIGTPAADTYNYPSGTNNIYIGGSDVGGSLSADFNGFINDLRVTAGVARYTGSSTSTPNFTLPNGPFPRG